MAENGCPLCGRELGKVRISEHHLIPKSKGGKDKYPLHDICHRKIHATFSEKELAQEYYTFELLRANADIVGFVNWVKKKDPAFYDCTITAKRKK
jgi:hypothetical protein